ncbi:MAG: thermonuclease family protein [Hyphomonadaceae bacterium]|nr:thermonuclease family protein [Hyphomonadaceae bacterium]
MGISVFGRTTRRSFGLGLAAFVAGCSPQSDLTEGEQGRIARITDGDVLGLDTGLKVRLAEIEAPAPGYDGRPDEPFAPKARDILKSAALGRSARLWYGGLSRDDYERALAHVIALDETGTEFWLNGLMVKQGAARVRTWPDNSRRAGRLLAIEAEARTAKRGLWSLDHWRIRQLDDLADPPSFVIVEGRIAQVSRIPGDGEAHLSPSGIHLKAGERLGEFGLELKSDKLIRVRGRIDTRDGSTKIRVTHWAQVEVAG